MNVLTIFTQPIENNTSSMIRCRNVINGLATLVHNITVYSPYPDTASIYYGNDYKISENVIVRRYGKPGNVSKENKSVAGSINSKSFLRKIYRKFDLFGASIVNIKYTKDIIKQICNEKYDIILSFSNPMTSHIMSNSIVKYKRGIKYIQQWGDPLVADITRKSLTPKWIQHIIESHLICKADRIFYVSPVTLQEQRRLFPKYKEKMAFVATPAEIRVYDAPSNDKLRIGYFGSYQKAARNIMPLYEAVKSNRKVEMLLVGDSDVVLEETDNIKIVKRTTPDVIDELMKGMDLIVCLMNSSGGQIPGKTYNYACTNKEILMVTDGEQSIAIMDYFKRYDRFTFVENNSEKIGRKLKQYIDEGVPIRKPVKEFTPETIAEKMIRE